ncbi:MULTISPECIES: 30S ribosomal protein S20 [Anoxynatronum]|uniref:Small ribosomal subunit protein bS20 n=2 Tax=Anoxynatronum TaxID=210622 RepID=A0AA46AHJ1_9CLOT|nr:30S ribosomal protein S20 [Anoxynatronum buryatiense]SMP39632.1 small subunit ribosomal protein S20 [Anoxynatronum buryatiense]
MANIKSAMKRIRVIRKKTARNKMIKSQLKTAIRRFEEALDHNQFDVAKEKLQFVDKKLKQAAAKNIIHTNNASRKLSRLTKKLNRTV